MSFEEWELVTLQDVCSKITDGSHFSPKEDPLGLPMASVKDLTRFGINTAGCKRISSEDFRNLSSQGCAPQKGDVLVAKDGNSALDTVCVFEQDDELVLLSSVAILRPNDRITSDFLCYYLGAADTRRFLKENFRSGSAIPRVVLRDFRNVPIRIPSLSIQKKIAGILRPLDDKIRVNYQTSATLGAIAQAIFKEWFVGFNFPGATGEVVESELGMIPRGWRVTTFESELVAERGLSYKGAGLEADAESAVPMHNLNSVLEGGGYKFEGIKYYSGEYRDKHIVKPDDLIVANTEQGHKFLLIGYPAIVPSVFGDVGIFSHHIYRVRPKQHSYLTSDFLYQLLLQPAIREQVVGFSNGTTVNMLKVEGLQKPKFVLPPEKLVTQFSALAKSIRLQQESTIKQSVTLAQSRDSLLPKLMRGEIEV